MAELDEFPDTPNPEDPNPKFIRDVFLYEFGQHVFDRLCRAHGGEMIEIPYKPETIHAEHHLARAIGLENAIQLVELVGPFKFYVPVPDRATKPGEDPVNLCRLGYANWEIAYMTGFTERHVRRVLNRNGITNQNRKPRRRKAWLGKEWRERMFGQSGPGAPVQSGGFA